MLFIFAVAVIGEKTGIGWKFVDIWNVFSDLLGLILTAVLIAFMLLVGVPLWFVAEAFKMAGILSENPVNLFAAVGEIVRSIQDFVNALKRFIK